VGAIAGRRDRGNAKRAIRQGPATLRRHDQL
jgi:hypothetical protein